eukprot:TRINITY_DN18341_c0_g1_i1.p1 TRINITY_DN18341_c0_g1~~TRINITY_DN18341_c0_g1_i1.p1  ORF type:complete len:376 (+),score=47.90 TRINITY_DN18341_c0_g1_i1:172-1299(+)
MRHDSASQLLPLLLSELVASSAATWFSTERMWRLAADGHLGVFAGKDFEKGDVVELCYCLPLDSAYIPEGAQNLQPCLYRSDKRGNDILLFPFGWGVLYNEAELGGMMPNLEAKHEETTDSKSQIRHYLALRATSAIEQGSELCVSRCSASDVARSRDALGAAIRSLKSESDVKILRVLERLDKDADIQAGILPCPSAEAIEVKFSDRHGNGVYAMKNFLKGETIEIAPSLLLMKREVERLFADYQYSAHGIHPDLFRIALGYGSIYNHDAKPNVGYRRVQAAGSIEPQLYSLCYFAQRDIAKGEELLISYGKTWWSSRGVYDASCESILLLPPPRASVARRARATRTKSSFHGHEFRPLPRSVFGAGHPSLRFR